MPRRLFVLLPALLVACDSTPAPVADAGLDAPTVDVPSADAPPTMDAPTADAGPALCGPEPRVHFTGLLTSYVNPMTVVAGAALTVDLCPGVSIVSDRAGMLDGFLSRGVAYNPRVEAPGYLTLRTGEQVLRGDFDASAPLLPSAFRALLPHFSTSAPTLLAAVSVDDAPDAGTPAGCASAAGAVFRVVGHPEAVVTYYAGDAVPRADPSLRATTALGLAEISGLAATAAGQYVELQVEKPGCDRIAFRSYPHTGRYRLEDGVVTLAGAFSPPLPEP